MLTFKKIIELQYFQHFRCIASDCPDSCCTDWDIVIDEATFAVYQQCENEVLKPLFQKHIMTNTDSIRDSAYVPYARVKMNDHDCPFLTDERLCIIQKTLGEAALSTTCATYPRTLNCVDHVLERSLYVSCPEAARLVLMNEQPMQLASIDEAVYARELQIPVLNTAVRQAGDKPYSHFWEIRIFIISLLQDRSYPLWQRLIILSVFCARLEKVAVEHCNEVIPELVSYFAAKIQEGVFREPMNNADNDIKMQLQVMKVLIDYRLKGSIVSKRFLACVFEFMQGLGYTESDSLEAASLRYGTAYAAYYQPFMEKHEYILENYLVNYIFKNLFPFGQQKSICFEHKSVYPEYILLVIHYSLIKTLLIGIAGYHQDDFSAKHVVTLVQTFAKAIEHNPSYLNQAVKFIEENKMNNTGGMRVLIKN